MRAVMQTRENENRQRDHKPDRQNRLKRNQAARPSLEAHSPRARKRPRQSLRDQQRLCGQRREEILVLLEMHKREK